MSKIPIIIQREFLYRTKKKSFIILTILMPFLFAALLFVPLWLSSIKDDAQLQVVIIDRTNLYGDVFKSDQRFAFVYDKEVRPEYKQSNSSIEAVVEISDTLATHPDAVRISSCNEVSQELLTYVSMKLNERTRQDKLKMHNLPNLESIITDVQQGLDIKTVKWNDKGEESTSNTGIAIAAGFIFTFLIYLFVMSYGGMVMQSVMEEKTSRIVEIMVSSVKPFELMMGKIIGTALVGFAQLLIWGVMLAAIIFVSSSFFGSAPPEAVVAGAQGMAPATVSVSQMSESQQMMSAIVNLPYLEMGVLFVLYFIGGYLLYASFFAAVGASVTQQEDSSQFIMPVIMLMVFGIYAAMYSVENTDGPLAFWSSMFPLTSPIVMMVRVPFNVPVWQEVLSLVILYGTALLFVYVGARIYRVGILMYGKKPSIKEICKWIRYK